MNQPKSTEEPTTTVYITPGDEGVTRAIESVAQQLGYGTQRVSEIVACHTCQRFSCICVARSRHAADCRFLISASCPVGIECDEHGRDVCPKCDACTCGAGVSAADLGRLDVR